MTSGIDREVAAYVATHSQRPAGTVHLAALDAHGDMACVTSTSGHAFKPPGRVGDTPIAGAGFYCDNTVGTCGSLGHGESNLRNCTSFFAVDLMRRGVPPLEAGLEALRQIMTRAPAFDLDANGRPISDVRLYLLTADGRHAGVSLLPGNRMVVSDEMGTRFEPCVALFYS